MRILLILAIAAIDVAAQSPTVQFTNTTRPGSADFQIGDRFEIVLNGAANQSVSVRTTMSGRTGWGPVVGWTDMSGRWSTTGQYERSDFGDWSEVWTVGRKRASPVVHFSVSAPCLKGGQHILMYAGLPRSETCDTAEGRQTFVTPSDAEPFRTPDGRAIPGRVRSSMTAEQYQMELMQSLITIGPSGVRSRQIGDEAAALITKIIGDNALTESETRNVLSIIRAAFERPYRFPPAARNLSATLLLLQSVSNATEQEDLKQQIAEAIAYVQRQVNVGTSASLPIM
jgi:hypothetical protein